MNSSDGSVLEGLENDAREAKKGLWADPAPIPQWVYRKGTPDGYVGPSTYGQKVQAGTSRMIRP